MCQPANLRRLVRPRVDLDVPSVFERAPRLPRIPDRVLRRRRCGSHGLGGRARLGSIDALVGGLHLGVPPIGPVHFGRRRRELLPDRIVHRRQLRSTLGRRGAHLEPSERQRTDQVRRRLHARLERDRPPIGARIVSMAIGPGVDRSAERGEGSLDVRSLVEAASDEVARVDGNPGELRVEVTLASLEWGQSADPQTPHEQRDPDREPRSEDERAAAGRYHRAQEDRTARHEERPPAQVDRGERASIAWDHESSLLARAVTEHHEGPLGRQRNEVDVRHLRGHVALVVVLDLAVEPAADDDEAHRARCEHVPRLESRRRPASLGCSYTTIGLCCISRVKISGAADAPRTTSQCVSFRYLMRVTLSASAPRRRRLSSSYCW